jgi:hypothetical protein
LTELEISEVWPRRPSSLVDFHTGGRDAATHDGGFQTSFMAGRARLAKKMAMEPEFADIALRRLMNRSLFVFRVRAFFSLFHARPASLFSRATRRRHRFADVAELGRLCPGPYGAILAEFKAKTGEPHALEWIKLVEDEDFSAASDSLQALTVGSDNAPSNKTLNSIARMCLHLAEPEDSPKTQSLSAASSDGSVFFFFSNSRRETRRNPTLSPLLG